MDANGYQLDYVLFGVLFFFKKKNRESNRYRVHVRFAKMFDSGMNDLEGMFCNNCNATPVKTSFNIGLVYIDIWRYGKEIEEGFLQDINNVHNYYMFRVVMWQLLMDFCLLISFAAMFSYEIINVRHGFYMGLETVGTIISLVLTIYRIRERIILKQRLNSNRCE